MKEYNFDTTPIVDIANNIITDAVFMNASDIHFDPAENYLKLRVRVDGELRDYSIVENKYKRNLITRIKLLAGMNITESRLPQDGAIKSNINGKDLDLRVSCLPTSYGEKIVVRILDYSMSFEGIEALGFTKDNYEVILQMLANPNGIILVTGATGSGKSTTVYSMIQRLNKEGTNILTVEDPVEMNIEGVNQVQVNSDIGLDFGTVLRSILRQDPNIILIGEIRDSETAQIAIRASITGHLVLSTLHTNNSLTTIERLLDMNVERYLLSSSLKGIISQNLAKRLCEKCRRQRPATETEKKVFEKALHTQVNEIYEPVGCPSCREGYKGRIAIQEVLLITDEIRDAINENVPRSELRRMIYQKGVRTLFQDGLIKVINGITSMDEVFRIVDVEDDEDNIYGKEKEDKIRQMAEKDDANTNAKQVEIPKLTDIQPIETTNPISDTVINNSIENNTIPEYKDEENVLDVAKEMITTPNEPKITTPQPQVEEIKHDDINNLFTSLRNETEEIPIKESVNESFQVPLPTVEPTPETITAPVVKSVVETMPPTKPETTTEESNKEPKENVSYTEDLINLINQGFFE